MNIVRLWGGVGNQLFEYLFGVYLQELTGEDVYYDINTFNKVDPNRKLQISLIIPHLKLFSTNYIFFSNYKGAIGRLLRLFFQLKNNFITEKDLQNYIKRRAKYKQINYFQGYWQNIKFLESLNYPIDYYIQFPMQKPYEILLLKQQIKNNLEAVAIHVRRGDYFLPHNIDVYGVCTADYYNNAIEYFCNLYQNPYFYLFTDDPQWVKENISLTQKCHFIVPEYQINDLWYIYLMSKYKNIVISNSTFSWWGAYLNQSLQKIVISPNKWLLNSSKTLALDSWIQLPC